MTLWDSSTSFGDGSDDSYLMWTWRRFVIDYSLFHSAREFGFRSSLRIDTKWQGQISSVNSITIRTEHETKGSAHCDWYVAVSVFWAQRYGYIVSYFIFVIRFILSSVSSEEIFYHELQKFNFCKLLVPFWRKHRVKYKMSFAIFIRNCRVPCRFRLHSNSFTTTNKIKFSLEEACYFDCHRD